MNFTERFNELVSTRGVMAKLSKSTGISAGLLSNYKSGTDPTLANLIKIADYFGITLDNLAGHDASDSTPELDHETQRLLEHFSQLNRDGQTVMKETLEFQLSKNAKGE